MVTGWQCRFCATGYHPFLFTDGIDVDRRSGELGKSFLYEVKRMPAETATRHHAAIFTRRMRTVEPGRVHHSMNPRQPAMLGVGPVVAAAGWLRP